MAVESPSSPGHGTLPDYWIEPTISEFLSGKDVEMNFTLALIKKNRK